MNRFQKLLALVLTVVMLCASGVTALADMSGSDYAAAANIVTTLADDYTGKTVILHSNDVHGAVSGYAYIAALKDIFAARGAEVLLVDAGDFSQGTTYVSTSKGATAVEMMNAAGYDIVTLGNHEFDFGYAQLVENLAAAEFTTLCADVIVKESGASILDGHAVVATEGGLKLGFFGMETPETATKVNPGLIREISFVFGADLYACAQAEIDALKAEEVDLVIGITHLGVDAESAANGYRSIDLYANTTGADLLLDGHSHTVMTAGENGEPIQSTGTKFAYVGVVVIDNEKKAVEDNFLMPTVTGIYSMPEAADVAAKAQAIIDEVDAKYGAVFATSEVLLNGDRAPGNRTQETNLGDLITDAMVWSVVKEGGIEQEEKNVVGITNGGGIRAAIQEGDVTMNNINTVLPFGNTVAVVYVTGSELLEALEASTYCTPEAIGGYPQTSGIEWTLDTTKAFDQGENYPETTYYAPASIQRVTIEAVNGEAFDPEATYAVVTNNFCAAGGDTYYVFGHAFSEGAGFDTGIPMDEAVMAYVADVLDGVITAEAYGEPRGTEKQIAE